MEVKIFIGTKAFQDTLEGGEITCKKISHGGKEFIGHFAEKNMLTLKEVITIAEGMAKDPHHITLIPILMFG